MEWLSKYRAAIEDGPALVRKLEAAAKMAQALRVAIHNCTWKWGSQMNEADEALAAWDSASAPAPATTEER